MLARNRNAVGVDDLRVDTARPQPARQPHAIAAGLVGDRNPLDPTSRALRFGLPAIQQSQQRGRVRFELFRWVTLDPGDAIQSLTPLALFHLPAQIDDPPPLGFVHRGSGPASTTAFNAAICPSLSFGQRPAAGRLHSPGNSSAL